MPHGTLHTILRAIGHVPNHGAVATSTSLSVAITDSADPVITGVGYSYTVTATNTGAATANTVLCTVTLDASLTYVSATGTGWTVDASALPAVKFTRATMAVGAAPAITINVTSGASGTTASTTANCTAANASAATPSTQTTTVNLVTTDGTALKRIPQSATEWANLLSYLGIASGGPSHLHLCQEASGNLADTIGGMTLTANATPLYQQAVTGWSTKAVGFNETLSQRFSAAAGVGPNASTQSVMWLIYGNITSLPGATRDVVTIAGGASPLKLQTLNSTGAKMRSLCIAAGVNGTADPTATGLQPMVIVYDRTAGTLTNYTLQEKFAGTYSAAVVDSSKGFGALTGNSQPGQIAYSATFLGSAAELTSTTVKNLLQGMGWTISAWS